MFVLSDLTSIEELSDMLRNVWNHNNLRTLNLFFYSIKTRAIFTFSPFEFNNGKQEFGLLRTVTNLDTTRNMNQYPVLAELFESTFVSIIAVEKTFEFRGVDFIVGTVLADKLNFSLQFYPRDGFYFGSLLQNRSFTGALGRISRRETDIALVGFFIKDYLTRDIEFTSSIYSDKLCITLKKASRVHPAHIPLLIFENDVWISMGLYLLLSILLWISLSKMNGHYLPKHINQTSNVFEIVNNSIKGFVSAQINNFPTISSERIYLSSILITSLVCVSMFQSNLANFYIKPLYYKDVHTLEQLDKSTNRIIVKHRAILDDALPPNISETVTHLRSKLKLDATINVTSLLVELAYNKKMDRTSYVTRKINTLIEDSNYYMLKQLYLVDECPRSYNLAFITSKHSYLSEWINDVLLHMLNGGLIYHWTSEMIFNKTMENLHLYQIYVPKFRTLTIVDLQFSFFVFVFGICISIITLGTELMIGRELCSIRGNKIVLLINYFSKKIKN